MRSVRSERSAAMAADATLTPIAARCLAKIRENGGLIRLPGGYWVSPNAGFVNNQPSEPWDIQSTIDTLLRRGLIVVTASKRRPGGHSGSSTFPTAVKAKG